jgi:hypothetical protein
LDKRFRAKRIFLKNKQRLYYTIEKAVQKAAESAGARG